MDSLKKGVDTVVNAVTQYFGGSSNETRSAASTSETAPEPSQGTPEVAKAESDSSAALLPSAAPEPAVVEAPKNLPPAEAAAIQAALESPVEIATEYISPVSFDLKLGCESELIRMLAAKKRWANEDLPNSCTKYRDEIQEYAKSATCQGVKLRDLSQKTQDQMIECFTLVSTLRFLD